MDLDSSCFFLSNHINPLR